MQLKMKFMCFVVCGWLYMAVVSSESKSIESTTESVTETVDEESQKQLRREYAKKNLLPDLKLCGMQPWDDYIIHNANKPEYAVDRFPWLIYVVSFEHKSPARNYISNLCTGVLINQQYALTHGKCASDVETVWATIGSQAGSRCIETPYGKQCPDRPFTRRAEFKLYSADKTLLLLRFNESVEYSVSVRPICLPLIESQRANVGDTITRSGWKFGDKNVIKYTVENNEKCDHNKSTFANIICVATIPNNDTDSTSFLGLGGLMMHKFETNWFLEGILGEHSYSRLFTSPRITPEVVNWILDNIEA